MTNFRAGTRPGERTSASIREVEDGELAELFGEDTKAPYCALHYPHRKVVADCAGCQAEAAPMLAIAQRRNRRPLTLARKHSAWKEAGGGTEQFDLDKYDRLMR